MKVKTIIKCMIAQKVEENNMNFLIKALPTDECNPDFAPDKTLQEGVECAGYFMVSFDEDGDPVSVGMNHVTVENLATLIEHDNHLAQAAAIASGYIEAERRYREQKVRKIADDFKNNGSLKNLFPFSDKEVQ